MKKKFISKNKKTKKIKPKIILFFIMIFSSFIITIKALSKYNLPYQNSDLVNFLIENNNPFIVNSKSSYSYFHQIMTKLIDLDLTDPLSILDTNFKGLTKKVNVEEKKVKKVSNEDVVNEEEPTIYLYNSHDTEEYKPSSFAEYSVMPTVKLSDYVLKEKLEDNGFSVLIEEQTISSIRSSLGLNYAGSYTASRVLMEQAKENYPSLIYFIDLHRDSLSHDKTTLTYNDKNYAKVMFLVGLENPNYQGNLDFSTKISEMTNAKIPGLSKGIYKKEGEGVNGVYNQDFSNRTILIEVGGPENTIDEVYETLLVLSEVLTEVINNDQN